MTGLLTGHCHLKGHPFIPGLAESPWYERSTQASETSLTFFMPVRHWQY